MLADTEAAILMLLLLPYKELHISMRDCLPVVGQEEINNYTSPVDKRHQRIYVTREHILMHCDTQCCLSNNSIYRGEYENIVFFC